MMDKNKRKKPNILRSPRIAQRRSHEVIDEDSEVPQNKEHEVLEEHKTELENVATANPDPNLSSLSDEFYYRTVITEEPPERVVYQEYNPQKMVTCATYEWIANTEVRYTLSAGPVEPLETEIYRPHAPIPSTIPMPELVKPVPIRCTPSPSKEGFSTPSTSFMQNRPNVNVSPRRNKPFRELNSPACRNLEKLLEKYEETHKEQKDLNLSRFLGTSHWKVLLMSKYLDDNEKIPESVEKVSSIPVKVIMENPFYKKSKEKSLGELHCVKIEDRNTIIKCIEETIRSLSIVLNKAKKFKSSPEKLSKIVLVFRDNMKEILGSKEEPDEISDLCPVIFLTGKEENPMDIISTIGTNLHLDDDIHFGAVVSKQRKFDEQMEE